jgi:hypothetical protein
MKNLYMFKVLRFGVEQESSVCEYGETEEEARKSSKKWLKKGEVLGDLQEINGSMVD